jgi:hypothetical protein
LSNGWNTVVHIVIELADTMEMETGTILGEAVIDCYNNSITPTGFDCGTWHGTVDDHSRPCNAVRRDGDLSDVECVLDNLAGNRDAVVVVGVDIKTTELVIARLPFARNAVWKNGTCWGRRVAASGCIGSSYAGADRASSGRAESS